MEKVGRARGRVEILAHQNKRFEVIAFRKDLSSKANLLQTSKKLTREQTSSGEAR